MLVALTTCKGLRIDGSSNLCLVCMHASLRTCEIGAERSRGRANRGS